MADRAAVFGLVQIGKESTAGTQVTPTKKLQSMSFALTPNPTVNIFRPSGYLFATVGATNYEQTDFSMTGQAVYDELQYLYSGLFKDVTPTTPGGGTNSRLWTYTLSTTSANTPATYTVESGDTNRGVRAGYMQFTDGGFTVDFDKGMQLSGGGFAQKIQDNMIVYITRSGSPTTGTWSMTISTASGITGGSVTGQSRTVAAAALQSSIETVVGVGNVTVTGGPAGTADLIIKWIGTYATGDAPLVTVANAFDTGSITAYYISSGAAALPLIPIVGSQFDFSIATTMSGLSGATPLTRAFNFTFKVANRFAPIKPVNTSNNGTFAEAVEAVPTATFGFTLGADDTGMAQLTKLRANTKVFARLKATGATIEGSLKYQFIQDMCLILNKPSALKEGNSLLQIDYEGAISHDATSGYAMQTQIQNTQTSL